ncbi:MAG TPA: glycosyltransferase family 1 protein [Acidimicrobiales bacterium]|nr:glycosyltransferase family 1 protein [Acidimicrobiales bacterium]
MTARGAKRGVVFDLVGAQSPSYKGRGIARYSAEMVRAVAANHPELVSAIVVHPELPVPQGLEDLGPWLTNKPDWAKASVLHMTSVFELEVPVRTFWPRQASANHLLTAVTVYDLIPDIFPGWYLVDPGLRRRWRACREIVRAADVVFTLSESARQDTIALLGVPPRRVSAIGSGTAPAFRPAASRPEALKIARRGVRGLRKGFILYVGAFNPRKNVDRLLQAYASMPRELIERHQLVLACEAPPLTRNHYLIMAKDLGVEGRLLVPGFVPDEIFVALHQTADLAVYPSLYEGYGLPVVDAMACGVPAIAGDNSSLREVLPREARFQPEDPGAIGEAMARALSDARWRKRLIALAQRDPPSWEPVADKVAAVFEQLLQRASRLPAGWRSRLQVATVGAPPQLAEALAAVGDCDHFEGPFDFDGNDGDAKPTLLSWPALARLDRWRGGYDAVVSWAPSLSEQHMMALEQLGMAWPDKSVAVVPEGAPGVDEQAISKLETWGLKVVPASPERWEEVARQVVGVAQAGAE